MLVISSKKQIMTQKHQTLKANILLRLITINLHGWFSKKNANLNKKVATLATKAELKSEQDSIMK